MAFNLIRIELICHQCGAEVPMVKPAISTELNVTFKVEVMPCKTCIAKQQKLVNAIKEAIA